MVYISNNIANLLCLQNCKVKSKPKQDMDNKLCKASHPDRKGCKTTLNQRNSNCNTCQRVHDNCHPSSQWSQNGKPAMSQNDDLVTLSLVMIHNQKEKASHSISKISMIDIY